MKIAVMACLFASVLTGCTNTSKESNQASQSDTSTHYRFASFAHAVTEADYWRQDMGRVQLAGYVGDLNECLVQEVVQSSSPALHQAVQRFLADNTEANYRAFPLKGQWFIGPGKISVDQFAYFAYARCSAVHPPEEQQAGQ